MKRRIILPLDNKTVRESQNIISKTSDLVWGYKIRRQILEAGTGFINEHDNMMVDFKLYDIPSAMEESAQLYLDTGAKIVTAHCSAEWIPPNTAMALHIAGVTVITSFKKVPMYSMYTSIDGLVQHFVEYVINPYNYGFMVCSPKELKNVKTEALKITPGIRPSWYQEEDDQARTMTPKEAVEAGSDLLVIGRPLLNSKDIRGAIQKTIEEIGE